MKKLAIIGAILTALPGLVGATQPAFADTSTATFQVKLTIIKGCAVSTPADINLGSGLSAGTLNSSGATGTTNFTVTCTNGTGYTIGFSGINDGADTTTHNMKGVASGLSIPYQLTDTTTGASNTKPLSAISAATPSVISDKGTGSAQPKTIQAAVIAKSIPGGAGPDAYSDTVTLTLSY
jgi:spore coat protein U-like protein